MGKPTEMPLGLWIVNSGGPQEAQVDSYSPGGANWRNLANTTEPSVCGGDAALLCSLV